MSTPQPLYVCLYLVHQSVAAQIQVVLGCTLVTIDAIYLHRPEPKRRAMRTFDVRSPRALHTQALSQEESGK